MVQLIIFKIRAFSLAEGCFAILCDLMSKKSKRVAGETSLPPYGGGGVYEDPKTRLKHQALLQDYQDLQKVNYFIPFISSIFVVSVRDLWSSVAYVCGFYLWWFDLIFVGIVGAI